MIERPNHLFHIERLLRSYRVAALIGARQVGKTTLARMATQRSPTPLTFFDLENPEDQARLNDPMLALKSLNGLVVLDEIQRMPSLFEVLRVLVDRPEDVVRFLVLGSASPELVRRSSETLAGRIAYHTLPGFSLDEVGIDRMDQLWLRGGFPRSFLADSDLESHEWRLNFIRTFLERDLPQLGTGIRSVTLRRFWTMLAHYHGQIWNSSEFARSFGVADTTVRNYLDILTGSFVVRQLPAWSENISKRQVKAPKVYIADSGLLHTLLNLRTMEDLQSHPKVGASWEGFVIGEIIQRMGVIEGEAFFWATHSGAELDLLIVRGQKRIGFEVKLSTAPGLTKSMRQAFKDLKLDRLDVVHMGDHTFPLAEGVRAIPVRSLLEELERL